MELVRAAQLALSCLDLTNLDDACKPEDIDTLCARARSPHGPVAAVCIWPRFVARARELLAGGPVRIATVVNFPTGEEPAGAVMEMTRKAVGDGADEIDLVIPYRELMEGASEPVLTRLRRVKESADGRTVKAILETGVLEDEALIREACRLAIEGGADFLKTSTGKVRVNATLRAGRIMLEEIAASGAEVGFKPAGGIRTTEDAAAYIALAEEVMGQGWVSPKTFRIGASSVYDALIATIEGTGPAPGTDGY
ncbi:MAG: deoxyribose-phosphate aldolase [Alphaproteobacteria bacterium]|nr:MAG: deoxyribose-phosphate aldolase [Alphaproteobacteria bacterium]